MFRCLAQLNDPASWQAGRGCAGAPNAGKMRSGLEIIIDTYGIPIRVTFGQFLYHLVLRPANAKTSSASTVVPRM